MHYLDFDGKNFSFRALQDLLLISLFLGENKESDKGLAWIIRDIADIHVLLGFCLGTDITLYY